MPLAGPRPRTTEMFIRAWATMASVRPAAIILKVGVGAFSAIVKPRHRMKR